MKKKILLIGFAFCMLFAFAACGEKKDSSTESVAASDVESSMGDSTSELPTPGEHNFTLVPEKAGTCNAKSEIAHYVCSDCGKKVDLTMQDIESVEGDYDFSNHVGTTVLSVTSAPSKIDYKVGETFDPTGMVIVYLCGSCQGETLDNQFLTYAYQTEGATAFSQGDTKVTVQYNGLSFDIAISVQKLQAEISGLQEAYETVCGVAPIIDVTTNVPECPVTITYFDGETEVTAEELIAVTVPSTVSAASATPTRPPPKYPIPVTEPVAQHFSIVPPAVIWPTRPPIREYELARLSHVTFALAEQFFRSQPYIRPTRPPT